MTTTPLIKHLETYIPLNEKEKHLIEEKFFIQQSIKDFTPMDYIPATVNLTVYDSGQVKMGKENFQIIY